MSNEGDPLKATADFAILDRLLVGVGAAVTWIFTQVIGPLIKGLCHFCWELVWGLIQIAWYLFIVFPFKIAFWFSVGFIIAFLTIPFSSPRRH